MENENTTPRIDGRMPADLREIKITPNYLRFAEGSVLMEWGNNKIICAATVAPNVPPWMIGKGEGWVTAEYSMLPRSGKQRNVRDVYRNYPNARAIEIQRLIGRALRAVCDMSAFGERMITIDCDVVESDGGTRTASITGGFVALALAIENLRKAGQIGKKPIIKDYLAAVSVGIVEGRAVSDLNYMEDSQAETDMNVVMTGCGDYVEIQGTAEENPFSATQLQDLLGLAKDSTQKLIAMQKEIVTIEVE
ncbi:ribonuclease PH [bacterium]|nr:ribonuclease PH [bacterium]